MKDALLENYPNGKDGPSTQKLPKRKRWIISPQYYFSVFYPLTIKKTTLERMGPLFENFPNGNAEPSIMETLPENYPNGKDGSFS